MNDLTFEPEEARWRVCGAAIKRVREDAGLSVVDMAAALGWSRQYLHNAEARMNVVVSERVDIWSHLW
jgi:transcriptional regulator with XRE-family HTH domain